MNLVQHENEDHYLIFQGSEEEFQEEDISQEVSMDKKKDKIVGSSRGIDSFHHPRASRGCVALKDRRALTELPINA